MPKIIRYTFAFFAFVLAGIMGTVPIAWGLHQWAMLFHASDDGAWAFGAFFGSVPWLVLCGFGAAFCASECIDAAHKS